MPTLAELLERAVERHRAGQLAEAEALYHTVLRHLPENADALHLLGVIRLATGAFEEGSRLIRNAIAAEPLLWPAWRSLAGHLEQHAKRPLDAAAAYRHCARLAPEPALYDLDIARNLHNAGQSERALVYIDRALARRPGDLHAHRARAAARMKSNRNPLESLAAAEALLAAGGDDVVGWVLHASALNEVGRYEDSLISARRALALEPANFDARHLIGLAYLALGAWGDGFPAFESRSNLVGLRRDLEGRVAYWDGRPRPEGTLQLHHEGGYGDVIQFLRFVPAAAERFARINLYVKPPLTELIAHSLPGLIEAGRLALNPPGDGLGDGPVLLMMSLADRLGARLEPPPWSGPYLRCPPAAAAKWRGLLAGEPRPRVGICWNNEDGKRPVDHRRDIPVEHFLALKQVADIRLISVKSGPYRERTAPFIMDGTVRDLSGDIHSFGDSAGLLGELDLLITIDTAIAHLAGALGVPVWLLINVRADWRWLVDRPDSPWYPSVTIFRAGRLDDWDGVFARVRPALAARFGAGAP